MTDKGVTIIGKNESTAIIRSKWSKNIIREYILSQLPEKSQYMIPKNGNIKFQELPCPVTDIYSISSISPSNDKIGLGTDNGFITYDTEKKNSNILIYKQPPSHPMKLISFIRTKPEKSGSLPIPPV